MEGFDKSAVTACKNVYKCAHSPGGTDSACFRDAMKLFEKAEALGPPANDDALLRWNSCARMIMSNPDVAPTDEIATRPRVGD